MAIARSNLCAICDSPMKFERRSFEDDQYKMCVQPKCPNRRVRLSTIDDSVLGDSVEVINHTVEMGVDVELETTISDVRSKGHELVVDVATEVKDITFHDIPIDEEE